MTNTELTPSELTPMDKALIAAEKAASAGEVPVAALIVQHGKIIATSGNRMIEMADATAHAEMLVIRQAIAIVGAGRLTDCDLYVTLEPCTMCAGAISHARLRRVYFGAEDQKTGAVENGVRFFNSVNCLHRPEIISGIGAERSSEMLRRFFASRR